MSDCGELQLKDTHSADAIANLISQFECAENFQALVCAMVEPMVELEQAVFDLIDQQFLCNPDDPLVVATGVYLDAIGELFGTPRDNMSDDEYRAFIKAKINCALGNATQDDMLCVLQAYLIDDNFSKIDIKTLPNGYFEISIGDNLLSEFAFFRICELVNCSRPAASHYYVYKFRDDGEDLLTADDSSIPQPDLINGLPSNSALPVNGGFLVEECGTLPRKEC